MIALLTTLAGHIFFLFLIGNSPFVFPLLSQQLLLLLFYYCLLFFSKALDQAFTEVCKPISPCDTAVLDFSFHTLLLAIISFVSWVGFALSALPTKKKQRSLSPSLIFWTYRMSQSNLHYSHDSWKITTALGLSLRKPSAIRNTASQASFDS